MKELPTINFDMDGTIVGLYDYFGWLEAIRAFDVRPYENAKPMFNKKWLTVQLNRLQAKGYRLRIISWSSKESTPEFDEAVKIAKVNWLAKHLPDVHWDEIYVVPYGTPKHKVGLNPGGILFDDSASVRRAWGEQAFSENDIYHVLKELGR